MIAGTGWAGKNFFDIANWHFGITYSILILTFLAAHEFGHYFTARHYGVAATLPYFIPMPLPIQPNFGTFGAVIKTRSPIPSRKALFDIGAAGPIAGFIVCVSYLIYGLSTLPPIDYIYQIHPEYLSQFGGKIPPVSLHFGDTLLYTIMSEIFANPDGFLPPMNEIYHYPFLCVGWFGLFVTALNMLPIGQLDGGHITFAMFGKKHITIAKTLWWFIFAIGIFGALGTLYQYFTQETGEQTFYLFKDLLYPGLSWLNDNFPWIYQSWAGWLFWAVVTRFFIKLKHPPIDDMEPLDPRRRMIGWLTLAILLLCFSFNGIYFIE
jgi:membrane-associated protease RseP (regulator of RpoE activity)